MSRWERVVVVVVGGVGYVALGILQQTLNEEGETDKKLTKLAETINVEAEN